MDLALNNLKRFICHELQTTKPTNSLLLSLPGPLWPRVVVPSRVLFIELNITRLCTYAKLNCLK